MLYMYCAHTEHTETHTFSTHREMATRTTWCVHTQMNTCLCSGVSPDQIRVAAQAGSEKGELGWEARGRVDA